MWVFSVIPTATCISILKLYVNYFILQQKNMTVGVVKSMLRTHVVLDFNERYTPGVRPYLAH